jgi:adenylate kinase
LRIVLLGPPGAGKWTQAEIVSETLAHAHISSGDLFREEQEKGTELGLMAKRFMERGDLVPNEVTIKMILGRVAQPDCAKGCLLDGFPRNLDQAKALDEALETAGSGGIDRVALISVSQEELVHRLLLRGRADDTEETVRRRLDVYQEQTEPLIDHYDDAGKLVKVNGEQSIEAVGKDLIAALQY